MSHAFTSAAKKVHSKCCRPFIQVPAALRDCIEYNGIKTISEIVIENVVCNQDVPETKAPAQKKRKSKKVDQPRAE